MARKQPFKTRTLTEEDEENLEKARHWQAYQSHHYIMLKERTDAEAECTEDGRDGRIGATEYAEGNGTRKRGGKAECIT